MFGLGKIGKLGAVGVSLLGSTTPQYDVYVATTGSDSNNGLTDSTPKLTIAAGIDVLKSLGNNKTLYIGSGTYQEGINFAADTTTFSSRVTLNVYCDNVVIDHDGYTPTTLDAIYSAVKNATINITGTTTLRNLKKDGISAGGDYTSGTYAELKCSGVTVESIVVGDDGDGATSHGTSRVVLDNCAIMSYQKDALVPVQGALMDVKNSLICVVAGTAQGLAVTDASVLTLTDCEIRATVTSALVATNASVNGVITYTRCKFTKSGAGTWSSAAGSVTGQQNFYDCYSTDLLYVEMGAGATMRGNYGKFRIRMGRGSPASDDNLIENNAFVSAGSASCFDFSTYNGSSFNGGVGGIIRNNIINGYTTAFIGSSTAGSDTAFNAAWNISNNCLHSITNGYTLGLASDGGDITSDPLLVNPTTSMKTDWYVGSASPCVGAGTGGGNIGVGVA